MLAINRLLGLLGTYIIAIFFAIFLYEFFGGDLQKVILWYIVMYIMRLPFHVIAAKIFSKTGLSLSMAIGTVGYMLFFLAMYLLDIGIAAQPYFLLGMGMIGLVILSGFYWAPFHVDFASFSTKGHRGRQVSLFRGIETVIGIIAPLAGGFLVAQYSYGIIFIIGILMMFFSFIPLMMLPNTKVQYEFGFFETFRKMFSKDFLPVTISMMALGAENIVGRTIWPIFLFVLFVGEYLEIGAFASMIVVVTLVFQYAVGRYIDKHKSKHLLKRSSEVYALGWVAKAFAQSVGGVFAASTFHSFGKIASYTSVESMWYEKSADSGHYVDEYTVIRETALTLGQLLVMVILYFLVTTFSFTGAFLMAAVISLFMNYLSKVVVLKS